MARTFSRATLASERLALRMWFVYMGTMMADRIPMMAMVMTSSVMVKPLLFFPIILSSLY
jgi:hypothetical protein